MERISVGERQTVKYDQDCGLGSCLIWERSRKTEDHEQNPDYDDVKE